MNINIEENFLLLLEKNNIFVDSNLGYDKNIGNNIFMWSIVFQDNLMFDVKKYNVNFQNKNGNTPLMLAVKCGNIKYIQFLLSKCADIEVNKKDNYGFTALMYNQLLHGTSSPAKASIIERALVKNSAKTDILNNEGQSLLDIKNNNMKIIREMMFG